MMSDLFETGSQAIWNRKMSNSRTAQVPVMVVSRTANRIKVMLEGSDETGKPIHRYVLPSSLSLPKLIQDWRIVPENILDLFSHARFSVTDRQLRLFAVNCSRQVWDRFPNDDSRAAIEVSERYADSQATRAELDEARKKA